MILVLNLKSQLLTVIFKTTYHFNKYFQYEIRLIIFLKKKDYFDRKLKKSIELVNLLCDHMTTIYHLFDTSSSKVKHIHVS